MATIYGSVMLRPVRIGFLAAQPGLDDIQRAAEAATSSWGGIFFPILDVSKADDLERRLGAWSVDVLWPITADGSASALADRTGFRWPGRGSPYGPFDAPQDSLNTRTLDAGWALGNAGLSLILPQWPDGDLSAFCSIWFGRFDQDEGGRTRRDRFATYAQQYDVQFDRPFDPPDGLAPIESTGLEVVYKGDSPGVGLVLIDPHESSDLLDFWNLRASGAIVLPWPLGYEDFIEPFARRWITELTASDRLPKRIRGDGTALPPHLSIWSTPAHADRVEPLKALLSDLGIGGMPGHDYVRGWTGTHPLTTEFVRSSTIDLAPRSFLAPLPLPALPWPAGRPPSRWPGIVAAEVNVYGGYELAQERTATVPRVRWLAKLMARGGAFESFTRPNGEGGIYGVQATDETVTIPIIPSAAIIEGLFDHPEWRFSQSEDGQFTERLSEILHNSRTNAASQPAVREVLLTAARKSDTGMPFPALLQTAKDARGNWPGKLSRLTAKEYCRQQVLWLLRRKLLRMVLPVTCTSCRSALVLTPDELATDVRCGFCDESFPVALAVAAAGPKSAWHYRIAGHVPESRLRAALPVLAVATVLGSRPGRFRTQTHAMGVKIASPERQIEIDVVSVVDSFTPEVVLGEVKSHHQIDAKDVANLEWAQDRLREKGIECYILIATLNERLGANEISALRTYCEQAKNLLNPDGSMGPLALPIILTRQELSVDQYDDNHPAKWTVPGRGMSVLAQESCRRNLGMRQINITPAPAGQWTYEFEWEELPVES